MAYFRFPSGADSISVEQQQFTPIYTNAAGDNFFAAPDHFAPKLLEVGCAMVEKPSEAPSDTATEDLLANDSIKELGRHIDAMRQENLDLRSTITQVQDDYLKLKTENEELKKKLGMKIEPEAESIKTVVQPPTDTLVDAKGEIVPGSDTDITGGGSSITGLPKTTDVAGKSAADAGSKVAK